MTQPPQIDNHESYLAGEHIFCRDADPAQMSPSDFYWWKIEQAKGNPGDAILSVETYDDALRFAQGMKEELAEIADADEQATPEETVATKITNGIRKSLAKSSDEPLAFEEVAQKARIWSLAFLGLSVPESRSTMPFIENLSGSLAEADEEIASARELVSTLAEQSAQQARERFSLSEEEQAELEYIATGLPVVDRAEKLEVNRHEISKSRRKAVDKLQALSFEHAVRIGIEEGLIPLDAPLREGPTVELGDVHIEVLQWYSSGKSVREIAQVMEIDKHSVNNHLKGAREKLGAINGANLILRAFEEGVLTVGEDKDGRLHQLKRSLGDSEQGIALARACVDAFAFPKDEEDAESMSGSTDGFSTEEAESMDGPVDAERSLQAALSSLARANQIIHGTVTDVSRLMILVRRNTYHFSTSPFNSEQQAVLVAASKGAAAKDQIEEVDKPNRRENIIRQLGARSMPQAVSIAISRGYLRLDWSNDPYQSHPVDDPRTIRMISLIAKGEKHQDIAESMSYSLAFVTHALMEARGFLRAKNNAHLVRNAYQKGVLTPDGPSRPLHSALASLISVESLTGLSANSLKGGAEQGDPA